MRLTSVRSSRISCAPSRCSRESRIRCLNVFSTPIVVSVGPQASPRELASLDIGTQARYQVGSIGITARPQPASKPGNPAKIPALFAPLRSHTFAFGERRVREFLTLAGERIFTLQDTSSCTLLIRWSWNKGFVRGLSTKLSRTSRAVWAALGKNRKKGPSTGTVFRGTQRKSLSI